MARILLAEDEFLIRLALTEELAATGHEVIEAGSGDEALALFREQAPFDILVTDVQMPGSIDGVALAAAIRLGSPSMPVLYVTGHPESLANIGALGPRDAFARKPFTPSEVVRLANRLLQPPSREDCCW